MKLISRAVAALLPLLLAACLSQTSAPSTAPANVTVTAGESRVVLTWDSVPGLTYWIFYKEGSSVSKDDPTALIYYDATTPPFIFPGLTNDTQYSFVIAASDDNSKTGPASDIVSAIPRLLSPAVDWTVGTPFTANTLRGITLGLGNTTYVTVGDAATVFYATHDYTEPEGVTADPGWVAVETTALPDGYIANLRAITYGDALFIALGDDGSIISSADAVTWDAGTAVGSAGMRSLARGTGGTYIAVGDGGVIYKNTASGITGTTAWTAQTSNTSSNLYGVSYVNSTFIAVGAGGVLLTSDDNGDTWIVQTSNTTNDLYQVAYDDVSTYVAVGDNGTIISSADATTWTLASTPITEHLRTICFGPDEQFIAAGTAGILAYSATGADPWALANAGSNDLNSIVPADVFIAVGAGGANVSGK